MSRDLSRGRINFTNSITSFTYDQNQIDFISYKRHPVEPNIQATEYIVTPEVVFFSQMTSSGWGNLNAARSELVV